MDTTREYAIFDDHRYSQRIAVAARWFLLGTWLFMINYRSELGSSRYALNSMGATVGLLNGYLQFLVWRGRFISRRYVIALSLMDLAVITTAIAVTTGFGNTFFVFYYPALLILPLALSSGLLSLGIATLTAAAYSVISFFLGPGIVVAEQEERILVVRIATMFAVVAVAHLISRMERGRRREAVEAETIQSQRNLELQKRAQESELAAQQERSRIAREIHDGIAQSIYILSLQLETCVELALRKGQDLSDRLQALVGTARQTLLEVRHYIFDLKPFLAGQRTVVGLVDSQVQEFDKVSGVTATLTVAGNDRQIPPPIVACLYRVTQEILANVFKHAEASRVQVALEFLACDIQLTIQDDGKGFDVTNPGSGQGLSNIRQRCEALGGTLNVQSATLEGSRTLIRLPTGG
jgi:signal transduction histidine kinase